MVDSLVASEEKSLVQIPGFVCRVCSTSLLEALRFPPTVNKKHARLGRWETVNCQ